MLLYSMMLSYFWQKLNDDFIRSSNSKLPNQSKSKIPIFKTLDGRILEGPSISQLGH